MRIAMTADPELPVPPTHYGGIERVIDMLARGLVERGHEVILFAHPDSRPPCRLEEYSGTSSASIGDLVRNMWTISSTILSEHFDVVHSFGRLAYLLPVLPYPIPKLMTYQRAVTPSSVTWGMRLARRGSLHFTGVSRHIVGTYQGQPNWHVVYNGSSAGIYTFRAQVPEDAPLVFLGRLEEIKGPHLAIEVARQSGRRLVIAGNVPDQPEHRTFFRERIQPYLDGQVIQYVGPVDDVQKNDLLGGAYAFLMPVLWDDPCPVVMSEALACGTPIVGLRRGAVPEVVESGVNGFVCSSVAEMANVVHRAGEIDRRACRRSFDARLSDHAIVSEYEQIYLHMVAGRNHPNHR